MKRISRELLAIGILSGDIIGAGMFSLPYAFQKSGIFTGLIYLLLFGGVFAVIHLMYADIIMRTKEGGRFASYAREFVGRAAYLPALLITSLGAILVLSIYLTLSQSFGHVLFTSVPGFWLVGVFWLIGSFGILFNIKELAFSEAFLVFIMLAIIFLVALLGFKGFMAHEGMANLLGSAPLSMSTLLLPFGVTLFALMGRSAIPSVVSFIKVERLPQASAVRVIFVGTYLPALLYFLFALGILGLSGTVSEDAISGIASLHPLAALAATALGIIAILTTYVVLGISTAEILRLDLKMPKTLSRLLIIFLPLVVFFLGSSSFFALVSLVGGVFVAWEAIFIILIWRGLNKRKMPRFLIRSENSAVSWLPLGIIFIGFFYELIQVFS